MTQEEIIEMARQAGFTVGYGSPALPKHEAFAKLIAEKEREACAKVCDEQQEFVGAEMCCVAMNCATNIRARGYQKGQTD